MRGVRPTRKQKQIIAAKNYNPNNWLVVSSDRRKLRILNKKSKKVKRIDIE